jgi:hypothetical protein
MQSIHTITQSILKDIADLSSYWQDKTLQTTISEIAGQNPSDTNGRLKGQGAFGDKIGNNISPIRLFIADALEESSADAQSREFMKARDAYFTVSDKPAYAGETVAKAMQRTFLSVCSSINQSDIEKSAAIASALDGIQQCLISLDGHMNDLNKMLPMQTIERGR